MQRMVNIFIGGSIDSNISENYYLTACELGNIINERKDYKLIFDGCLGLPYITFKQLKDPSRSIVFLTKYYTCDYIYETGSLILRFDNQSQFINSISKEADAMIFMKGGTSTIAEIMHLIEAKKNGEHDKPLVILNINDEWKLLIDLLNSLEMNNFYYVTDSVIDTFNYIELELFKQNSSFKQDLQYLDRKEPIIEERQLLVKH